MGGMLYSGECRQTFSERLPNIPANVLKHSGECHQTFRGMSSNVPGNVAKHSGECHQTFWGMLSNIPGNVAKHSREYVLKHSVVFHQAFREMLPIFGVKKDNYWAESH